MPNTNATKVLRERRHWRARRRHSLKGTTERPRLNVFRSSRHIFAQIIDDARGNTLVSASTLDEDVRGKAAKLTKTQEAQLVGEILARRALASGIKQVVFDRGGYVYHGRVKSLAEASRKTGLEF